MAGSVPVYLGVVLVVLGMALIAKPVPRLGITTRSRAFFLFGAGMLLALAGLSAPARDSRVPVPRTRLDESVPVWQFREFHRIRVNAPPDRVFAAVRAVRADEISLFRALTWIRRGGRPLPEGILNAGGREPLIDVALRGGFELLALDAPREIVIGTAVRVPAGSTDSVTADLFRRAPAGYALAAMNFIVTPEGPNASIVTTETRVYANGPAARRRFAAYWRVIYPGSAIIRRMWLRAVRDRATRA